MEQLKVYWTPGCSSCVKVKEFLSKKGVDYVSVNVAADPKEMQFLSSLGVRTVPVVVRGREFVFAQSLEDVATFVGISHAANRLPTDVLFSRWERILEIALITVGTLHDEELQIRPVDERPRTIRDLAYHIFQVPEAFLRVVNEGLEDWTIVANVDAPSNISIPEIITYGKTQLEGVRTWWRDLEERSGSQLLKMFYGTHSLHSFLER